MASSVLRGKNIVLGVTGGIAAYKVASLVRLLLKEGTNVKVVMTENAKQFVTPLTLATLSKNPVISGFSATDGSWNNHVELALWADAMLIAPLTANTLSKMAHGQCDNLLLAVYFSSKSPVWVAPAMDLDMYAHPTVLDNLQKLQKHGNFIIPATEGELASGLVGKGRMAEPESIVNQLSDYYSNDLPLKGKHLLITAGPTYESIDPVRFIGNFSTGKMGIAIANEAVRRGAKVTLILGPSSEKDIDSATEIRRVVSTDDMYREVSNFYEQCDVAIFSAAVADYTPKNKATEKIKKAEHTFSLELQKTVDILETFSKQKKHQLLIGFALETENELENARRKLLKKNLDAIVLNSLRDEGAGFGTDTNKITFLTSQKKIQFPLKNKTEVAKDILNEVQKLLFI